MKEQAVFLWNSWSSTKWEEFRESPHFFSARNEHGLWWPWDGRAGTESCLLRKKAWKCHIIPECLSIHFYLELKPTLLLTSRAHSCSINFSFKTSGRKRGPSNSYSIEKWSNCHPLKTQGRHFKATVLNTRTHHFSAKTYENLFLLQMQVLALNRTFALCCQFTDPTCNAFRDSPVLQGLSKQKTLPC